MNSQMFHRIAGVAAFVALWAFFAMPWISAAILFFIPYGMTGFDLIPQGNAYLAITPLAALVCLVILGYSEVNTTAYEATRRPLAIASVVSAVCGGAPVAYVIYQMVMFQIKEHGIGLGFMAGMGMGVWLAIFAFFVLAVEAVIDYLRW